MVLDKFKPYQLRQSLCRIAAGNSALHGDFIRSHNNPVILAEHTGNTPVNQLDIKWQFLLTQNFQRNEYGIFHIPISCSILFLTGNNAIG